MKKEKDKGRKNRENGFTMIEVMIAIVVFSFALLGLGVLQLRAIKDNSSAIGTTEALNVAQNKMEELIALPIGDAQLQDSQSSPDPAFGDGGLGIPTRVQVLSNTIPATGGVGGPDYRQIINSGTRDYNVYWNVAGSGGGMRVRVIVAWNADGMHRIDLSCIKY